VKTHRAGFRIAAGLACAAWLVTTLTAVGVASAGVAGLAGWTDFDTPLRVIPRTHLVTLDAHPRWEVVGGGKICQPVKTRDYPSDCYGLVLSRKGQRLEGSTVLQGPVRPVAVSLHGDVTLDADPGWHPLLAGIYAMAVAGILVISYVLFQLWRLLRSAGSGQPFTLQVVSRLRRMGTVLVAWELAEPVLWLFLSPKAFDYGTSYYGPVPSIDLATMQPGGPQLSVIAFGALLVLLAEVFRYGTALHDEQKLTV